MVKENYTIRVYNTLTKEYEDVVVTKEVYETYRRTEWNIKDNNESYYDHEIQFSGLIGGEDDNYENFREFVDDEFTPENIVLAVMERNEVRSAICLLSDDERDLMDALYDKQITEAEYARQKGVSQQYINSQKQKIIKKMKKLLEKRL